MNDESLRGLLVRATDGIESPGLAERTVLLAQKRRNRRAGVIVGGALAVVAVLIGVTVANDWAIESVDPADLPSTGDTALDHAHSWLAAHDYTVIAHLRGPRVINVTVERKGDVTRGDVQTMNAAEEQVNYYRFRITADHVVTTSGPTAPDWQPATSSQRTLLEGVADPSSMLLPLDTPGLRSYGRTGDADMYRDADGDSLLMIDGRPVRVVTHGTSGDWTRTFEIDFRRGGR